MSSRVVGVPRRICNPEGGKAKSEDMREHEREGRNTRKERGIRHTRETGVRASYRSIDTSFDRGQERVIIYMYSTWVSGEIGKEELKGNPEAQESY